MLFVLIIQCGIEKHGIKNHQVLRFFIKVRNSSMVTTLLWIKQTNENLLIKLAAANYFLH